MRITPQSYSTPGIGVFPSCEQLVESSSITSTGAVFKRTGRQQESQENATNGRHGGNEGAPFVPHHEAVGEN
jgi:hypothetical protein